MAGSDKDCGMSRRPSAEDQGWSSTGRVLGGQAIGTPCAVCTIHKEMRNAGFLVYSQNQGRRVSRFGPQNR
jgi:hypothetical protein